MEHDLHARQLSFRWQLQDDVSIWADPVQLAVVVSELLRNALRFSPEGEQVTISTDATTDEQGTWARFSITDDGPGLTPQDREHLFDPFYSGRQAGRGLGFGLCKCWRIVTGHGGQITPHPQLPHGLTMTVLWPARNPE